MEPGALTPEEQDGLNKVDSAHELIFDHWDHANQRFKHPDEIQMEKEMADAVKLAKEGPAKQWIAPEWMVDDWTGTRFAENILCYNKTPCPAAPIAYAQQLAQ
jgi:hypothetical protein